MIEKIFEGGNSVAVDRSKTPSGKWNRENWTTKAQAEKMDMSQLQRSSFRKEFLHSMEELNKTVQKETGRPLWNNFNVVKSGIAFNGSSNAMFDDSINDDDFLKAKPKVGDIDITVPRDRTEDLFDVLLKYEDKKFGKIKYIGNNRQSKSTVQQINAVFEYDVPGTDYIAYPQVDFEPSDYENDAPTEWDSFSHSSDWEDIKRGFKGVNHKYALTIMAHVVSRDFKNLPGIMLNSKADKHSFYVINPSQAKKIEEINSKDLGIEFKSEEELAKAMAEASSKIKTPPKTILKKTNKVPVDVSHYLAFSVTKGLRVKYRSLLTKDEKPIMLDGKMVLIPLDSKTSNSVQNLKAMFKLFFGYESTEADLKKMGSFVGVIELLKKSKLKDKKKDYEQFLYELIEEKLWGTSKGRAQELERDSKEIDAEIKWSMVNYIMDELNVGDLNKIKKIANDYYDSWKGGADDSISEHKIPKGTLSQIFEQVQANLSIKESFSAGSIPIIPKEIHNIIKLVPRGYKHFSEDRLKKAKKEILNSLTTREETDRILAAINNSRLLNDFIRKNEIPIEVEQFL